MSTRTDPRGPFRTVERVELATDRSCLLVTFRECGHVGHKNAAQAAPRPGEQVRCFACREDAR